MFPQFKFEIPTYNSVKEFWTNYFKASTKFWNDFAEDVKQNWEVK